MYFCIALPLYCLNFPFDVVDVSGCASAVTYTTKKVTQSKELFPHLNNDLIHNSRG